MFNTGVALARLERDGVTAASAAARVTAKDVVDGDRHATLRLLWAIIARYSLSALLSRDDLAREAEGVVSAARKWRNAGSSPARPEKRLLHRHHLGGARRGGGADSRIWGNAEDGEDGGSPLPPAPPSGGRAVAGWEHPPLEMPDVDAMCNSWGSQEREREGEEKGKDSSGGSGGRKAGATGDRELLEALLVWCQAVCHGYGVAVRNFTTSFADGRALCLLLHYYHPRVRDRERGGVGERQRQRNV